MDGQDKTITENATPGNPQKKSWITMKTVAFVGLIIIALFGNFYFFYPQKRPSTQSGLQHTQLNKKELSGHILFVENKAITLLDPKTEKTTTVLPLLGLSPVWEYQNNYIFIATDSAITRYSLLTHQSQSFALKPLGIPSLSPSPDGQKVEVANWPGYPGSTATPENFVYDFSTATRKDLPPASTLTTWFGDSNHMLISQPSTVPAPSLPDGSYSGSRKLLLYDLQNGTQTPIAEGPIYSISVSKTDFHVLWFQYAVIPNPTNPLGDKAIPSMYTTTINPTADTIGPISMTPFSKFPVIARDFQGIGKVLPGKKPNFFFTQMGDKRGGIYFTDSYPWGTYKKISPDGPFTYQMVSYNQDLDKVLAYKITDELLKPYGQRKANYPAQIVLIDEGSSSERVLTTIATSYPHSTFLFSPDNTFILGPKVSQDFKGDSEYTIYSIQNPNLSITLKTNLGNKFYWIQ